MISTEGQTRPQQEVRHFATMTEDLLKLSDWLTAQGITHVAIESTGVYWKPIFNILESHFEVILVNAQHVKAVPGRKTDVIDCQWLCDLLRHGLLKASFIPPAPIRELRDLTRYRKSLVQERAREVNRLQKVLETANIKLRCVASDVLGVSGRAMLEELVQGNTDVVAMAELAKGKLREKRPQLERALSGRVQEHHRFLIAEILSHIDYIEATIERIGVEIGRCLRPFEVAMELLKTIPGVKERTAQVVVAEIGTDMSIFPSHRHLAAWAGLCPGNKQSGGKRKDAGSRKGDKWLRAALVEAAWAAVKEKDNFLRAQYYRLAARRGKKRAIIAVAHSILVIVYHILKRGEGYRELGGDYYDQRDREALKKRLVQRLERLGMKVTVQEQENAA
jgi:transposase